MAVHKGIRIHQCLDGLYSSYPGSSENVLKIGLAGKLKKSELEPKQVFNFVGYQRPTPVAEPARENTGNTIPTELSGLGFHVLDRSATATEKQWWLEENNVLQGKPLQPIKHTLQIFTDASKEGWGAHLNEHTARGSW